MPARSSAAFDELDRLVEHRADHRLELAAGDADRRRVPGQHHRDVAPTASDDSASFASTQRRCSWASAAAPFGVLRGPLETSRREAGR